MNYLEALHYGYFSNKILIKLILILMKFSKIHQVLIHIVVKIVDTQIRILNSLRSKSKEKYDRLSWFA